LRFKQTPAVEASLVYGISLVLSFALFLILGTASNAMLLAQYLAALMLMPTWVLSVMVGQLTKRKSRYRRYFWQVSVLSLVALAVGVFVIYAKATFKPVAGGNPDAITNFEHIFSLLDLVYYATTMSALAFTHFFIFRKQEEVTVRGNEYGVPPRAQTPRVKPSRPAPPSKPKRNK